jgi:hypothetical protein
LGSASTTIADRGVGRLGLSLAVFFGCLALYGLSPLAPAKVPAAHRHHRLHVPKRFFGIAKGGPLDRRDLKLLQASRVPAMRFQLSWRGAEPKRNVFDWSDSDEIVGNLAAHRIQPFPFVLGSPHWMYKNSTTPPLRTVDRKWWQRFLKAVVDRYGPGGAYWTGQYQTQHPRGKPMPIRDWQIWNEPNLSHFWPPQPNPAGYAELVKLAHDAIKSQDPGAKIVLAGMPGFGNLYAWDFLDQFYAVPGITNDFDAVSVHPYSPGLHQVKQELMRMRRVMQEHGDGQTPLWITEIGWASAPPDGSLDVGMKGQKERLIHSFRFLLKARDRRHIGRVFWYDWRDPVKPQGLLVCQICAFAGLLKHNHKPKPAYYAYRAFTRR